MPQPQMYIVRDDDDAVLTAIEAFIEVHNLAPETLPSIRRAVMNALHGDALLAVHS